MGSTGHCPHRHQVISLGCQAGRRKACLLQQSGSSVRDKVIILLQHKLIDRKLIDFLKVTVCSGRAGESPVNFSHLLLLTLPELRLGWECQARAIGTLQLLRGLFSGMRSRELHPPCGLVVVSQPLNSRSSWQLLTQTKLGA